MRHFSHETSKKLEDIGLECFVNSKGDESSRQVLTTLDIFETNNAVKLWAHDDEIHQNWRRRIELDNQWQNEQQEKFLELLAETSKPNRTRLEIDAWQKRFDEHINEKTPFFDDVYERFTPPKTTMDHLKSYSSMSDDERVSYVEQQLRERDDGYVKQLIDEMSDEQ